ncbi:MAG: hypothetical protein FD148_2026, partial [Methylocystaceae bacterium]
MTPSWRIALKNLILSGDVARDSLFLLICSVRIHPLIRKSLFARRVDIIFENFGAHFRALTL